MKRQNLEHLHRFLTAETEGRDAAAERALQALFLGLPAGRPRPGFAGRVLAAAGVARPPWSVPRRAAVAACLLAAGLAAAYLPPILFGVARALGPGRIFDAVIRTALALYEQLALVATLGSLCETLYRAFVVVATSPPAVVAWILALAVSVAGGRALSRLLTLQRSSRYVEAR